jgi:hypothetical protein
MPLLTLASLALSIFAAPTDLVGAVFPDSTHRVIHPGIYGMNRLSMSSSTWSKRSELRFGSMRLGGNRMTGYNWETDHSNAGSDYIHSNDTWLRTSPVRSDGYMGLSKAMIDGHSSLGEVPIFQLQLAGWVAADAGGAVAAADSAPSSRWKKVLVRSPGGSINHSMPSTTDDWVALDAYVTSLAGRFPRAWCLDNEPVLWSTVHPRIVGKRGLDLRAWLDTSASVARMLREIDPGSEIQGPEAFGFPEMWDMQNIASWKTHKGKSKWATQWYLSEMRRKSDSAGQRLLDTYTFHWYPETKGGATRIVFDGDNNVTTAVADARMQAPRALWDSTYLDESSWIRDLLGRGPTVMLPRVQTEIDRTWPGTGIGITEYYYGGTSHVSGGIAQADFLGVAGRFGVRHANLHTNLKPYLEAALRLYRNFDGAEPGSATFRFPRRTPIVRAHRSTPPWIRRRVGSTWSC